MITGAVRQSIKLADQRRLQAQWGNTVYQSRFFEPAVIPAMRSQLNYNRNSATLNRFLVLAYTNSIEWDSLPIEQVSRVCKDDIGRLKCKHCDSVLNIEHVLSSCTHPDQCDLRASAIHDICSVMDDDTSRLHSNDVFREVNRLFEVPLAKCAELRSLIRVFGALLNDDAQLKQISSARLLNLDGERNLLAQVQGNFARIIYELFNKSKQCCCNLDLP